MSPRSPAGVGSPPASRGGPSPDRLLGAEGSLGELNAGCLSPRDNPASPTLASAIGAPDQQVRLGQVQRPWPAAALYAAGLAQGCSCQGRSSGAQARVPRVPRVAALVLSRQP